MSSQEEQEPCPLPRARIGWPFNVTSIYERASRSRWLNKVTTISIASISGLHVTKTPRFFMCMDYFESFLRPVTSFFITIFTLSFFFIFFFTKSRSFFIFVAIYYPRKMVKVRLAKIVSSKFGQEMLAEFLHFPINLIKMRKICKQTSISALFNVFIIIKFVVNVFLSSWTWCNATNQEQPLRIGFS